MSDIVDRLRDAAAAEVNGAVYDYGDYWNLCDAAADEIARLRAERDRAVEVADAATKGVYSRYMLEAADAISMRRHQSLQINELRDRIAHLERVQEAADVRRNQTKGTQQ